MVELKHTSQHMYTQVQQPRYLTHHVRTWGDYLWKIMNIFLLICNYGNIAILLKLLQCYCCTAVVL